MNTINFTAQRIMITSFTRSCTALLALYGIYKDTIEPAIEYDMFVSMYCSEELIAIDFTLFMAEEKRAGFSAVFFYKTHMNGKTVFIARSATGLQEEHQGKGRHNVADLYMKFIRFAVAHPLTPIYAAAFVINPFVFGELCRFVPRFFPMPDKKVPDNIEHIMDEIVARSGHTREQSHPYCVKVPIQVVFSEAMLKRIYSSKDKNIIWFMKNMIDLLDKYGVLVVVEVSWSNIWGTIVNLGRHYSPRKKRAMKQRLDSNMKKAKQKTFDLLKEIFQKWTL